MLFGRNLNIEVFLSLAGMQGPVVEFWEAGVSADIFYGFILTWDVSQPIITHESAKSIKINE